MREKGTKPPPKNENEEKNTSKETETPSDGTVTPGDKQALGLGSFYTCDKW
jgi:tRNA-dihydrouridine synthase 1